MKKKTNNNIINIYNVRRAIYENSNQGHRRNRLK